MKLDVKDLVFGEMGGEQKLSIELFKEVIDEELQAERIKGNIKITRLDQELLVKFAGTVKLNLVCDRCVEDFKQEVPIGFTQLYSIGKEADDENLRVERGFQIDISEPLRQEILVSLPYKKLCKTDCLGICQKCGQNLNEKKCRCKSKNDK